MEETNKFLSEKLFVILYYIISLALSYKTTDYNSIYRAKTSKENFRIRNKYKKQKTKQPSQI
jgi:hypothetical protein